MAITVTLHREKCIGCGYCSQVAGEFFAMSSIDGKSDLIDAIEKKGFYSIRIQDIDALNSLTTAKKNCPVKVIRVQKNN